MIIIIHQHNKTIRVLDAAMCAVEAMCLGQPVTKSLKILSEKYPDELMVWCHKDCLENVNFDGVAAIFHHKRILATYAPTENTFLPKQVGYVERSFFLKINKNVSYPTWLMSSCVGGVHAEVITTLSDKLNFDTDFDYFLNALAKRGMVEGLFCYSEPKLLSSNTSSKYVVKQASTFQLFKFVKQHYKWVWVFFLFACYLVYDKKPKLLPLLYALCFKRLNADINLEGIPIKSSGKVVEKKEVDVIIPTIGRKLHLYQILKDLSHQTLKPKTVIIVEQNPVEGTASDLDFIKTEDWPFKIKHKFIHKTGVCNARNVALKHIGSEWVFLADDDIRIATDFFKRSFEEILNLGAHVINYACLLPNQTQMYLKPHQTTIFGAGSSMVKHDVIKHLKFNMAYEHNFGEDTDFGMQIRNSGYDVIYVPNPKITHLKAPIGGYRTKIEQPWEANDVKPKPSPTIQLLYQNYFTKQQILGYKLLLGLRVFKNGKIKNPFKFISHFKKQWQQSEYWCAKLQAKN